MIRSSVLALCLSGLAALTLACGLFDSDPELRHAVATLQCGPADQGFTAIVLAPEPIASPLQPPFPHVGIMILESVDNLAGRTWDITTSSAPVIWYVTGPDARQAPLTGRVRVTSVDSARTVTGSVELRFPSRPVVTEFRAPWVESLMLCG